MVCGLEQLKKRGAPFIYAYFTLVLLAWVFIAGYLIIPY